MRRYLPAFLAIGLAHAQAIDPKAKASESPVHLTTPDVEIGAEYMVRSFGGDRMYIAPDHLVVQIALYPLHKRIINVDSRTFRLRLNGKKDALFPQSPGMVAASVKYPDWRRRPTLVFGGGMGDTGISVGRPQPTARFPGDNRPVRDRLPAPPSTGGGVPRPESADPEPAELITVQALQEGPIRVPVTGYLYFGYEGKLTKLKSVELLYYEQPESAPIVLRLR